MVIHGLDIVLLLIIGGPIVFVNKYIVNDKVVSNPKWNSGWWLGQDVEKNQNKVSKIMDIVVSMPRWQFVDNKMLFCFFHHIQALSRAFQNFNGHPNGKYEPLVVWRQGGG